MVTSASKFTLWPYALVAVFVLFAGYIGYMVQQAMRSSVDLVSPDYYQQELAYQRRMESVARTAALPAPVQFHHAAATRRLTLHLPPALARQAVQGEVHFFRPSDQLLDFTVPLHPAPNGQQLISTSKLRPGLWRVRLAFTAGEQAYFMERTIMSTN